MKKIIIYTLLTISIPIFIINLFNTKKQEHNNFSLYQNINVRIKRTEKNIIENIPLEKYLIGVLAGEMPVSYDLEALKAQAVAART